MAEYSSSKDNTNFVNQPNTENSNATDVKSKVERLSSISGSRNGQITYIGKLAIAVPNEFRWTKIYDDNDNLIKRRSWIKAYFDSRGRVGH
jgi:hypothetical protein